MECTTQLPILPGFVQTFDADDEEGVGGHPGGGSRVPMFEKPDTAVVLSWPDTCTLYRLYCSSSVLARLMNRILGTAVELLCPSLTLLYTVQSLQ